MSNWWEGDPFKDFGGGFNFAQDFANAANWEFIGNQAYGRPAFSNSDLQLLKQIKAEAIEYFNKAFQTNAMSDRAIRCQLNKEQKERVIAFMKNRLTYYNENGFLLS